MNANPGTDSAHDYGLEYQLVSHLADTAAPVSPSPALWERVRAKTTGRYARKLSRSSPVRWSWTGNVARAVVIMAAMVGVGYAALAREHLVRNMIPASTVLGGPADAAARAPIQALGEAVLGGDLRLWRLPGDEYLLRLNVDLSLQSPSVNVLDWTLTSDGCRDWSTTSEIVFRDQLAVPPEGRITASLIAPRKTGRACCSSGT